MLRTNAQNCVMKAVLGSISNPRISLKNPYLVDSSGKAYVLPGTGGISYNLAIGDSAIDFAGDHVEPCVSIRSELADKDRFVQGGLSVLSCIGNEAQVVSGRADGSKGIVTGKHGGVEHVIVDFPAEVVEKLAIGDRIQIKAFGQGLKLKDFPDIHVMNIDPDLLQKMRVTQQNGHLVVPVTNVIPCSIMGSGIGSRHSFSGDYDIQISEVEVVRKYALQHLKLGDVIAVRDADCRFGRTTRADAISIGIVVHASCIVGGHGPGVTVVMTTTRKLIVPKIDQNANLSNYIEVGHGRRKPKVQPRRRRR